MQNSITSSGTPRTVLLATVGTSPAVLTETVWALAHPAKKGSEIVVPDDVIALTTLRGKQAIETQLMGENGAWSRLITALEGEGIDVAGKLAFGEASIRLLDHDKTYLEDIRTSEENESVADLFLREVRSYTENPETRLYASIAGGRKTMGALLLSCMSLLGREQDHVLHVLVNEPFDSRLDPPFFFPEPKAKHVGIDPRSGKKKAFRATDARLDLIDLPFVKMRGWYQDKFMESPPSYSRLVAAVQHVAPPTVQYPLLKFDFGKGRVLVGKAEVPLSLSKMKFLYLAAGLLLRGESAWDLLLGIRENADAAKFGWDNWLKDFIESDTSRLHTEDPFQAVSRMRSELRETFRKNDELRPFADDLFPKRERTFGWYPEDRLLFNRKDIIAVFGPHACPGSAASRPGMSADIPGRDAAPTL